ncbi:hypothetical protein FS837_004932, partial [Tulasnella sp. UAMH 9824]
IVGTKALTVPEILDTILGYATPPTLASAARVSRAWSTIALDRLWSDHNIKVVDMLRVLPLHLEQAERPPLRSWSLRRDPTNYEWTRFYSYASRVRSLSVRDPVADQFDEGTTDWKIENNALFPKLRRIEWYSSYQVKNSFTRLRSFITPSLQELCLGTDWLDTGLGEEAPSFLNDLATTGGLRLKKIKLDHRLRGPKSKLAAAVTNLVAANKDSIEGLELLCTELRISLTADQPLRKIRALSFSFKPTGGEEGGRFIQVLVEGCPNVAHLRILQFSSPTGFLAVPGLRSILAWNLLSFEVGLLGGAYLGDDDVEEMAKAWPRLKKLNLNWTAGYQDYIQFSLSYLSDIMEAFSELEDLELLLFYDREESLPIPPPPEASDGCRATSRLQNLRLGEFTLPESQSDRDNIVRFLARVLPPGLRVVRAYHPVLAGDVDRLAEWEKAAATEGEFHPEWDALFLYSKGMQAAALPDGQATGVLSPLERGLIEADHYRRFISRLMMDLQTEIAGTKALMVPEILNMILNFAARSTLASAARVSKAWSSIALDRLWSGHDIKVRDLLQVLPVSHMLDLYPPRRIWNLVHDPTEEEWARFRSYASRVRSLVFPRGDPDQFDPRITEWKVKKEVLFPRLRRIEAHCWGSHDQSFPQLHQFIAPGLREFHLDTNKSSHVILPLLDVLATSEGLHLQKLELNHWHNFGWPVDTALADPVANLAVVNEASIEALEIPVSHLNASLIAGHSFLSLRALDFAVELLGGGGDKHPIQVLVEGCPHVAYLRIRLERVSSYPSTNVLDLPGLRMILTWHLLSLEVQPTAQFRLTKANLEEMGRAWPNLKKLDLNRGGGRCTQLPFSHLADIGFAFPQLEDLSALFHYDKEEETLPPTYRLSSEHRRHSRLRKLRLSPYSHPPRSESERDLVARFLAQALPPGLRIDRKNYEPPTLDPVVLEKREKAAATGRDIDPEWDALFLQIEELQGGVRIWVGSIPEDSDGVWFRM